MANAWREHVKQTMGIMKKSSKSGKVMLKDVLKSAAKTYKKVGNPDANKTHKKKRKTHRNKTGKKH